MRKPTFRFPTWSDTNQAVQVQKMVRTWNFGLRKKSRVAKTKALICVFVLAYAKRWFSHDEAQA